MLERFLEPPAVDKDCLCPHCGKETLYPDKTGWVCYRCDKRIDVSEPDYGDENDHGRTSGFLE